MFIIVHLKSVWLLAKMKQKQTLVFSNTIKSPSGSSFEWALRDYYAMVF